MRYTDQQDFRNDQYMRSELARLKQNATPKNPVTAFTVTANTGGSWGATINFTLGTSVTAVSSLRLLRNTIKDYNSAIVLANYPVTVQDTGRSFQFIDIDKKLTVNQFYWVETIPEPVRPSTATKQTTLNLTPIYTGPVPLTALNVSLLPPDPVPAFAVSLGARFTDANGDPIQHAYVNWAIPSDPTVASVQIRAQNYDFNSNVVAIAQSNGRVSPFQFNMLSFGETVTLFATAISQNGIAASSSPSVVVHTNGTETVPAANESLVALQIIGGNQLSFSAGLEPDISAYRLYRNTVNTFGSATLIHTFSVSGANSYNFLDTTGTVNSYYWVTSTNPIGTSAQSNTAQVPVIPTSLDQLADGFFIKSPNFQGGEIVVENGNFQDDPTGTLLPVVPGWAFANATPSYVTGGAAQNGNISLKIITSAQFGMAVSTKKWRVTPNEIYKVAGWVLSDGVGTPVIKFAFVDKNGALLGAASASNGTNATWTFQTAQGTVPANAVYAELRLENDTTAGAGACFFNNAFAVRVRSTDDELFDGFTTFVNKYIVVPTTEQNGVYNGDFQTFPTSVTVADGWTKDFETSGSGFVYARNTSVPRVGNVCQAITNNAGGTAIASRPYPVKGNASYIFETYARSTVANPGTLYVRALFYSDSSAFTRSSGNLIGFQDVIAAGGPTSANTWQAFSGLIVAPAGAKYAILSLYNWVGTNNTMFFQTAASFWTALNPAHGVVDAKGILCPAGTTSLTYSNNSTSITWNWVGLTIYRSDGTTTVIPNGSKAITGLSSSTTYYFYPFYNDLTSAVDWVVGPRGTPAIAFLAGDRSSVAAQGQNLDKCIPLSDGPVSAATTASGGGGGGTGGGSGCPAVEMFIDDLTQVRDANIGTVLDVLKNDFELESELAQVKQISYSSAYCVRLRTENGCELTLSCDTPVPTKEAILELEKGVVLGEMIAFAKQLEPGMHVITDIGTGVEYSKLTQVDFVGIKQVAHLYCGGRNFAAGKDPDKRIFSHNLRIVLK